MSDNILIAEFMGLQINAQYGLEVLMPPDNPSAEGYWVSPKYDKSWDWLMPVVKKIYEISDPDMRELFDDLFELRITSNKSTVYNAVIEFIKWHNSQKL